MGIYPELTRWIDGVKWFSKDEVDRREAVFKSTENALRAELLRTNKWNTKLLIDKDILVTQLLESGRLVDYKESELMKAHARNGVLLIQIRELQMEKVELLEKSIATNKKLIGCYRIMRYQTLALTACFLIIAAGVIYYVA